MKIRLFLWVLTSISFFAVSAQEADKMEAIQGSDVFVIVENMPEFPGGIDGMMKFLIDNIQYPTEAKEAGISGKVYINFLVDTQGKISDAKVIRSVHEQLDQEALRVVNAMPVWKPGTQKGKAVKVSFNLPIRFALDTPEIDPKKIEKE